MKRLTEIEWVWFDLDDTLWDFKANSRYLLALIYVERGLNRWFTSAEDWIARYEEHNHRLWSDYSAGRITQQFLRADRFRKPLIDAGHPKAEAESEFLDVHYLERLSQMDQLVDGAIELLTALRTRGYKIGVLSNGFNAVQNCKISISGLRPLIDMIVLSDDIGVPKPDRRIFDYATSQAKSIPDKCLMIGDNHDTDIAGAVEAGWRAIYFRRTDAHDCIYEVPEVSNLAQISYFLSV